MHSPLFLILVSSLLAVSEVQAIVQIADLGPKIGELVETLRSVCIPRSGTNDEAIQKVMNGEFTDEPKIKAYMRCLLEEGGAVDENFGSNIDVASEMIPPKILNKVLETIKICESKKAGKKDQTITWTTAITFGTISSLIDKILLMSLRETTTLWATCPNCIELY